MVRVVLLSIGAVSKELISELAKGIELIIYGSNVVVYKEPLEIPDRAFDHVRKQYLASEILRKIAKAYGDPFKHLCLGVTTVDLYAPGHNFIFGEADQLEGVAVVSIYRLKPSFYGNAENEQLIRERLLKEAVHELGHLMGLSHCKDPSCVMRFSNWIGEVDRKNTVFCLSCGNKIKTFSRSLLNTL